MRKTIFDHPVIMSLLSGFSGILLKTGGWKTVGKIPDHPKCVLIGAPHTSNWDFVMFLLLVFKWKAKMFWMGKDALFKGPFRPLMKWLGGIPVDRSQKTNLVDQIVDVINQAEHMMIVITPEGTRSKVRVWKSGFYHIAEKANLPIVLGYADFSAKEIGVAHDIRPTGDYEADMKKIIAFYQPFKGKRPDLGLAELVIPVPEKDKNKDTESK